MHRSKSGSNRALPVALELLEADHEKVKALFQRYERDKKGDQTAKRALAEQICGELKVHAQVEEDLFYPWLRENLDDMELVEEAQVEHASAKDLIAQLEAADEIDEAYDAKVKVLGEYIRHHIKEEEEEIFPEVRDMREELDELGQQMHARKADLMSELGLEAEPEEKEKADEHTQAAGRGKSSRGQQSAIRGSR